jgi:metal-sulfur cluster biosynthetic enzyme
MKDPNDIQYDDIPSNAEEMAAWKKKFGSGANNDTAPVGGVESRFDQTEEGCYKPEGAEEDEAIKEKIIEQLKTIYDPELPVDIYNLGLVYDIDCWKNPVSGLSGCKVVMTLTSATCSMSEVIVDLVRSIPKRMEGLECLDVELVFDPPWSQEKMSDEAKLAMGML